MLKYLVTATEDLITTGVLLGMLFAYIDTVYGGRGRKILAAGSLLGLVGAIVMAFLKNKTKLIVASTWTLRTFTVSIIAFLLLLALDMKWLRKHRDGRTGIIVPTVSAVLAFTLLFYVLPDVLAYPYNFVLGGQAVFSTGFLYRLIGLILGILLVLLAALSVNFVCRRIGTGVTGVLLKIALGINAFRQLARVASILYSRRVISGATLFQIVRFTSNHSDLFIYAILLVALVVPVALWIRSFRVNEPYENPAQRRKIRAKWRSIRRWSSTAIVCFAASVLIMTVVDAYANAPAALSPTEECELRGTNLYIPFEQVNDGHLHRFAYTTDNNVAVRFIIIQKPNSSAYGVGLDACDICGETGYYERSGQVVCNRCDVVMNINTIGFKGGCNPKIIDYSIENGYIIVPTYTLIEHESDFK